MKFFSWSLSVLVYMLVSLLELLMYYRDLQSYLSHLSLFLAPESKKFYILVDNRPWLKDLVSGAHFWQLMVTKVAGEDIINYL